MSFNKCIHFQPVHSEGDQPWDFFVRNDAKAETPVLWPPHAKSWLIRKDSDAGRDWGQEKGRTEDEMAGWHNWLNGCESEWTLRVGDGQGGLACCDSWGCKESDTTEQLSWADLIWYTFTGEGQPGNPLQYSFLENPMDRRAWWTWGGTLALAFTWQARSSTSPVLLLFSR